jgi:Raf kinase inhibitor-like YbhB/YbcL family protein
MTVGEIRQVFALGIWAALVCSVSCSRNEPSDAVLAAEKEKRGWQDSIDLRSPDFDEGGVIPRVHTCDGQNTSPPLRWSNVPPAARSLALICEDPDARGGTFTHWILFDIPPEVSSLTEGMPSTEQIKLGPSGSARHGKNDFGRVGYGSPCPPHDTHRYLFRLYALDVVLNRPAGIDRASLLEAIKSHILAEGQLVGRFTK